MQKLLLTVDLISTWVGKAFAWLIVALTLWSAWEVFSRYMPQRSAPPGSFDAMQHDVRHAVHDGRRLHAWPRTAMCAATCFTEACSRARRPRSTSCCTSFSSCPACSP